MATELDKIDFKILKLLQENGRITNLLLSQEIGLSPAPTLERVRKLEMRDYNAGDPEFPKITRHQTVLFLPF